MNINDIWGKTPREVMLEQEIKQMKGELEFYKSMESGRSNFYKGYLESEIIVNSKEAATYLKLAKFADISVSDRDPLKFAVLAKTHPNSGLGMGVSYYISNQELNDAYYQADILARLHEQFIGQLASFLKKVKS